FSRTIAVSETFISKTINTTFKTITTTSKTITTTSKTITTTSKTITTTSKTITTTSKITVFETTTSETITDEAAMEQCISHIFKIHQSINVSLEKYRKKLGHNNMYRKKTANNTIETETESLKSNNYTAIVEVNGKDVQIPVKQNKVTTNDIVQGQSETSETEVAKKNNKTDELFQYMRKRNIYVLCGQFRKLSELDAEDRFEKIVHDTTVKIDIPKDIKEYLHDLLSGDIESALSKVKEPLSKDARPLLLWTNEVCRHFIFYFYYGGLQIDGDEKTWSNQTVYRILDLFSMFFGKLTSGIAFGEIVNEAHKDRIYTTNVDQKQSNSKRGDKNDAVLYQDDNATVIYEQSFGPTEFDSTHYMGDITKLARNGVDDLNYHFLQYGKSSVTTAKKLKSIGIHGYKYSISIYLTDLICRKLYRTYEIFNCKIPTSYTDRWFLAKIAKIGVYFEALLAERQSVKGKMGGEDMINEDGSDCVRDWISVQDNTPETKRTRCSQKQ
ncbi:48_t:CDS:2, partial [Acaulospora morrowiae]